MSGNDWFDLSKYGYHLANSNLQQSDVWIRREGALARVVFVLQQGPALFTNETIETVYHQMERKLFFSGATDVRLLICLCTDNLARDRALAEDGIAVWLLDTERKALVIYENQPEDWEGLRGPVEAMLAGSVPKKTIASIPVVTILLVTINMIVFAILEILGSTEDTAFMVAHGASGTKLVIQYGQYWRLFTAMFLHFGVLHLFNNMTVLAFAGAQLEQAVGSVRFAILYLCSGLVGSIGSVLWYYFNGENVVAAGASGAIYGVLGGLIVMTLIKVRKSGKRAVRRCLWVLFLLIYGSMGQAEIDFAAHICGLFAGMVCYIAGLFLDKGGNHGKNRELSD